MFKMRIPVLLGLALMVGFTTGCPGGGAEPEVDESTITDPAFFFSRAVTALRTPDSKTGEVDYESAYADFSKAITLGGGAKAEYNAGWTAERLGKADKAESHYRKALDSDAAYSSALSNLADLLTQGGRYDEAVEIYRAYIAAKPGDLEVHNSLVDSLAQAGKYEESIKEAQVILRDHPENVDAYRNLSRSYFAQGEYGMSQLCAEKAKTLQEGDPGIYNNMGVTSLQQDNLPAAIESFKTAIKIDPDNVEANMNLGWVALNSGDYALALNCFTQVTTAQPESIDGMMGLAVAQRGMKMFDESSATYDKILKMDPGNEVAYFNAATLHEKYTKDFKKAKKILQDYVDQNTGKIAPTHDVFVRIDRIAESQAEEEARLAELDRKEKERLEREKRQKAQLDELVGRVASFRGKLAQANCPAVAEMGMLEEFEMIAEQGDLVVQAEDFAMAGDMITFLDSMEPTLDELIPMCATVEPSPAEAPPVEPPPSEAPPAPAEETPAPAEEAPAAPAEEAAPPAEGGE